MPSYTTSPTSSTTSAVYYFTTVSAGSITLTTYSTTSSGGSWGSPGQVVPAAPDGSGPAEKAERLLKALLNPGQARDWEKDRTFKVKVGDRTYLFRKGIAGNIYLLDAAGKAVERYCVHPDPKYPIGDVLIAQKLLLESDEARFLRTANRTLLTGRC